MDFDLTEAQRELAALTREILAGRVTAERLRDADAKDRFDTALWADLAGAGVLAAGLPEAVGGDGLGVLARCAVLIELGRAVAPVPYLSSIMTAAAALAEFGTPEQRERWAAPAARGELVLTAALGPDAVEARREGDRWVLTGVRGTVPAAPYADLVLVPTGAGVFLVAAGDDGVAVATQEISGGEGAGRLELSGVALGADRLMGGSAAGSRDPAGRAAESRAAGSRGAERLREYVVLGSCAAQLGVAERAVELTAGYARDRVQFGRPIGAFQAVRQRLADAHIDTEAIRLTMWQAAWRLDAGLPCGAELATAKFWAADAGHRVAHAAVHLHGGVGIDVEHPLHRYYLAATHHEFHLGGATASLLTLADSLAEHESTAAGG